MINILAQRTLKYSTRFILRLQKKLGIQGQANIYYFGYGANIGLKRFQDNYMRTEKIGNALLQDHELSFSVPCEYLGKGFASAEVKVGGEIWGCLFKINREALMLLDILEWVPFNFYRRKKVSVKVGESIYEQVWVYVGTNCLRQLRPDQNYLQYLIKSAEVEKLPGPYIAKLRSVERGQTFPLDPGFRLSNPSKRRFFESFLRKFYLKHDQLREKLSKLLP